MARQFKLVLEMTDDEDDDIHDTADVDFDLNLDLAALQNAVDLVISTQKALLTLRDYESFEG